MRKMGMLAFPFDECRDNRTTVRVQIWKLNIGKVFLRWQWAGWTCACTKVHLANVCHWAVRYSILKSRNGRKKYQNFPLQIFCWKSRRKNWQRIKKSCCLKMKIWKNSKKVTTGNQQNSAVKGGHGAEYPRLWWRCEMAVGRAGGIDEGKELSG